MLPKLPKPELPQPPRISELLKGNPLHEAIGDARSLLRQGTDDIRGIASSLRGDTETKPVEQAMPPSPEGGVGTEATIATGCLPCALGHFSTSSGLLNEAVRFKGEGMTSNEVLDRIAGALSEQNALERDDLSPEKIQHLPEWERPIADEALSQSRRLRHRLESIQSIKDVEQVAADTRSYYIKLNRQWYKGRFRPLGEKKADAIARRAGGA